MLPPACPPISLLALPTLATSSSMRMVVMRSFALSTAKRRDDRRPPAPPASSIEGDLSKDSNGQTPSEINNMEAVQDLPVPVLTAVALVIVTTVVILLLMKSKPALDPVEFQPFPLIKREEISHDTRRFTFALPAGPNAKLGLPVGQHITLKFTETLEDGTTKNHQRSYTPVTGDDTPGSVTFVIKVYKAGVHPKFPAGGKMSQHLDSLKVGDTVDMRGPKGHLDYHKNGAFTIHPLRKRDPSEERKAKHFGMIAGGTGEENSRAQFCVI